ncbi:MAG TPA: hypothetical protein VND66_13785 [Acidobacteriaceae bacterium]|nr:hypothetical protein [Terriglobia bacterium]HVC91681.1 hypothetical protein [Acidobacteriaceae bacterium]
MTSRANNSDALKDEVYRHMFRLEARRPGAEMDLAIALVRTCVALYSARVSGKERQWLERIGPICISMFEAARPKTK